MQRKGNHHEEAYCCDAIWDVVFTTRTEEFTFREETFTEGTRGCDLFRLGCIWSPARKNHVSFKNTSFPL